MESHQNSQPITNNLKTMNPLSVFDFCHFEWFSLEIKKFSMKIVSRISWYELIKVLDTFFVPFHSSKNTRTDNLENYTQGAKNS